MLCSITNSAYGKKHSGFKRIIDEAINDNRVLYFNEKNSQQLLSVAGPNALNGLSSADQYGNIAKFREGVKDS